MESTDRTGFGPTTTADDVLAGIDLHGRLVLVTGASSGIGAETARAMAARGAQLVLALRNMEKGEQVAQEIRASTGNAAVELLKLELDSLDSVRDAAAEFLSRHDRLDLLLNNAGVMACPFGHTTDGYEMQFGTNHLGHFLFTGQLLPALLRPSSARVVNLSSRGHRFSPVVFEDIGFEQREYNKWAAYGQSKTTNILHAVELDRRFASQGLRAFAVHPGAIITELGRHMSEEDIAQMTARIKDTDTLIKSIPMGAATSCYAATAPELEGMGGRYLADCQLVEIDDDPAALQGLASYAVDAASAARLWELSEQMTGAQFSAAAAV
ncbi:SDR family NAD(P)-dependent oxidoreductase [bacterium]|nr:SDR family NAD(P)-dependent oxidoreductase [bacterium]